jgi:hypothetical protein
MIGFADFVPAKTRNGGFFTTADHAPIQEAVDRANAWIAENNVQVFNVETVTLPNMYQRGETGPQDSHLNVYPDITSEIYQFVRVWYKYGQ